MNIQEEAERRARNLRSHHINANLKDGPHFAIREYFKRGFLAGADLAGHAAGVRWIPCTERKPGKQTDTISVTVWATNRHRIERAFYDFDLGCWSCDFKPTHWVALVDLPLPPPPQLE